MDKALVSICIPVYNGEKTIYDTVQAVLNQSYECMEILVIDNCSTDKTREIIRSIDDPRLKLICNKENVGMVGNWNKCLEYSTGDYAMIVCADDIITEDCVKKKAKVLEKYKDVAVVFSASSIIDDNSEVIASRHPFHKNMIFDGKTFTRYSFRRHNIFGEPSNVMFKMSDARKTGEFSDKLFYAPDWEYWMRLAKNGNVAYIDNELYKYRVSISNETSRIGFKKILEDDKTLISAMKKEYKLSFIDIGIHTISILIRSVLRWLFMNYRSLVRRK